MTNKVAMRIKFIICCLLLSFIFSLTLHARPAEPLPSYMQINREHAKAFGSLPMQSNSGRIQPLNTFSSEVVRKLHKSPNIYGLNSDQFLLSVLCFPDMWMQVHFIFSDNKEITFKYDLTDGHCSYNDMFDSNGRYKLQAELTQIFSKPASMRTGYEKDMIKLDEQVNILHQLLDQGMINLFPIMGDTEHKWYSPDEYFPENYSMFAEEIREIMNDYRYSVVQAIRSGNWKQTDRKLQRIRDWQNTNNTLPQLNPTRIKAELLYNKVNIFSFCRKIYLIMGASLLVIAFGTLFSTHKRLRWLAGVLVIHLIIVMILHLAGMLLRWYIAGYAPWSNSYETMVLLSFFCILFGMLFARHNILPLALSTLLAGVILFVSGLNWMNPQITPLVPVLQSPWLMIHVALIMVSYGLFGISCLLGVSNLILLRIKNAASIVGIRIRELTLINEMSVLAGLAFLCAGVFVGAIWANESWGRYWGWDPKETWALITIIVYVVATHLRLVKKWDNPFLFNLICVVSFASVIMTYFGVNYLLSGMHSYN